MPAIPTRRALLLVFTPTLGLIAVAAAYLWGAAPLIESIYLERSWPWLNHLIARPPFAPLEHYLTRSRVWLSRVGFLLVIAQLLLLANLWRRQTQAVILKFFCAEDHPVNLAIFRMVLFWMIFQPVPVTKVLWFSQLDPGLRVPPGALGWLLASLPINPAWAVSAFYLLHACAFLAMIGLWTRTNALLTGLLAFYVLGLPQLYGKVNHYHFLVWFPLLLAASRCADALSLDAVLAGWRRADRGVVDPPGPSRAYALPLRFVWILIGILYFFPGFWKLWTSGIDWALSENLKFRMHAKWFEGGWTPAFRIDHYPLLYKLSGTGTILFELSFLLLIFFPGLRLLAVAGGLAFHALTGYFMRITFTPLCNCYVAFIDWHRLFRAIGRRLYRDDLHMLYDGNCTLCRRTVATLRVFDLFGRVIYVNALDRSALDAHGVGWVDQEAIVKDMYGVIGRRTWAGFQTYRVWAWRIPLLWPLAPFLYLWPVPPIARWIYRRVADSRMCSLAHRHAGAAGTPEPAPQSTRAVIAVGAALALSNLFYGVRGKVDAWPFACFPKFQGILEATGETLMVVVTTADGRRLEILPIHLAALHARFSSPRLAGLIQSALSSPDLEDRQVRLREFWEMCAQVDPRLRGARSVQFYRVEVLLDPDRQTDAPLARALLFEM